MLCWAHRQKGFMVYKEITQLPNGHDANANERKTIENQRVKSDMYRWHHRNASQSQPLIVCDARSLCTQLMNKRIVDCYLYLCAGVE